MGILGICPLNSKRRKLPYQWSDCRNASQLKPILNETITKNHINQRTVTSNKLVGEKLCQFKKVTEGPVGSNPRGSKFRIAPNPPGSFSFNYLDLVEHFAINKGHCSPCMMNISIGPGGGGTP